MSDLVGANVRRLRGERNLTQAALAERAGLHRLTIVGIEKGRADNLGMDSLERLATALDVAVRDLLAEAQAAVKRARKAPRRHPRKLKHTG
jgi:transcriptional regulator with XRE-family HTH domain